jgi:prephenate dehydrogenase
MRLSRVVYWCNAALSIVLMLVLMELELHDNVLAIIVLLAMFVSFVLGAVYESFRSEEV